MAISISTTVGPIRDALKVTPSETCFTGTGKAIQGIFFTAAEQVTVHFPNATITFTPDAAQFVPFAALGVTQGAGAVGEVYRMV